jgi:multisubunit Na+/H+ antiporter MnhB subunit
MKNLFLTTGTLKTEGITQIINQVKLVANVVLGIVSVGVVFLAIFVGYRFMTADSDDKRKEAKAQLIYAIIGVIVAVALVIVMNSLPFDEMLKIE